MTSSDQPGTFSQGDLVRILNRQMEAGNALVIAGPVEYWLEKFLLAAGRLVEERDLLANALKEESSVQIHDED
jgi:hypothetical protein